MIRKYIKVSELKTIHWCDDWFLWLQFDVYNVVCLREIFHFFYSSVWVIINFVLYAVCNEEYEGSEASSSAQNGAHTVDTLQWKANMLYHIMHTWHTEKSLKFTWTPAFQKDLSSSSRSRYSPTKKVAKVAAMMSQTSTPQQPSCFRVEPSMSRVTCHASRVTMLQYQTVPSSSSSPSLHCHGYHTLHTRKSPLCHVLTDSSL